MDDTKEGILLIGTTMILLTAFVVTVLVVMLIYRKWKVQHLREIGAMTERFSRELLQAQMEVQQQTMQHIGWEIHDNVGQKLTLAVLYVEQLEAKDPKVTSIASLIHESLGDLRSLSKSLTDVLDLQGDLLTLVGNECARIQSVGLCALDFQTSGPVQASSAVKGFVLRILQEFLQNSLKHAGCSLITLNIQGTGTGLEISASDNGKGFIIDGKSHGLNNMKRRAEVMHADFTLDSKPGEGTRMRLFIPTPQLAL